MRRTGFPTGGTRRINETVRLCIYGTSCLRRRLFPSLPISIPWPADTDFPRRRSTTFGASMTIRPLHTIWEIIIRKATTAPRANLRRRDRISPHEPDVRRAMCNGRLMKWACRTSQIPESHIAEPATARKSLSEHHARRGIFVLKLLRRPTAYRPRIIFCILKSARST